MPKTLPILSYALYAKQTNGLWFQEEKVTFGMKFVVMQKKNKNRYTFLLCWFELTYKSSFICLFGLILVTKLLNILTAFYFIPKTSCVDGWFLSMDAGDRSSYKIVIVFVKCKVHFFTRLKNNFKCMLMLALTWFLSQTFTTNTSFKLKSIYFYLIANKNN